LLGDPEGLHLWRLTKGYQKVQHGALSVEHGAIRGQHRGTK